MYTKFLNLWSEVRLGASKKGIVLDSPTHQLQSQIGVMDTERLAWMSIGRHRALKGMCITNKSEFSGR